MKRKEIILKYFIYFLGLICLCAFIAIRFEPLFNYLLKEPVVDHYWDKTKYGEMYYFSMIRHFREKNLPPAQRKFEYSEKHASLHEADILTFGDSFFEFSRNKQFSERLCDDFNKKIHFVNSSQPLSYLAENKYRNSEPKLVIYERTERTLPIAFQNQYVPIVNTPVKQSAFNQYFNSLIEIIFYNKSEELYDALLKRSYLTTAGYSFISTSKFDMFGYISKLTPVYKKNGDFSWLFYHDQVDGSKSSFYYQFSQIEMDSICDNIKDLALKLKEEYNLDILYLPIPAKYTLYHSILNNDQYNNFIPRLYKGLEERGVKYVNIFDDLRNSKDTVFYRTDDHWTPVGIELAYSKTVYYMKHDSILSKYLLK